MKPAQVVRRSRIMTPLRLPAELRFLQRWNMFSGSWQLCHISKIFPINTFVALNGVGCGELNRIPLCHNAAVIHSSLSSRPEREFAWTSLRQPEYRTNLNL